MMSFLGCLISLFALLVTTALANTEKVIFTAPKAITLPDSGPHLQALGLSVISQANSTLATSLSVAFPSKDRPRGLDSWYLLNDLEEDRRYEVRVCWAAVQQPTEFWLHVYDITHVFDTPDLIQSLSEFAEDRVEQVAQTSIHQRQNINGSLLLLHVQAAADYFTTNKKLMQEPPLVDVEIILDRYLLNAVPESLIATAGYLIVIAVLAFFVSGWIWSFLRQSRDLDVGSDLAGAADAEHDGTVAPSGDSSTATASAVVLQRPQHPFYRLPSELISDIVDLLPPEAFINFAFANYPLVRAFGLAPVLSRRRVDYVTTRTQIPALFPLLNVPPELMLQIMQRLKPIDVMRFVIANYRELARQGIAPVLTRETELELKKALRGPDVT
ncbi:hypothetical protein HII31_09627 [Pseudocercospora fuligena]|uniref:F-box domain-containing protein n=1 Tax=Pseudocercospora fuligena TaxID=685502 RepID=A0A8H6VF80_9PEZI|nr:hypothetical protein HII31_09627 [Pseudocercospora fuligena]